jgi:hypothetical protein
MTISQSEPFTPGVVMPVTVPTVLVELPEALLDIMLEPPPDELDIIPPLGDMPPLLNMLEPPVVPVPVVPVPVVLVPVEPVFDPDPVLVALEPNKASELNEVPAAAASAPDMSWGRYSLAARRSSPIMVKIARDS